MKKIKKNPENKKFIEVLPYLYSNLGGTTTKQYTKVGLFFMKKNGKISSLLLVK